MLDNINSYLDHLRGVEFYSNSGYAYLMALGVFVGVVVLLKIFQVLILSRLQSLAQKSKNDIDDAVIQIFRKIGSPFYFFVALFIALRRLTLTDLLERIIYVLFLIAIVYEIIRAIERATGFLASKYFQRSQNKDARAQSEATVRTLQILIRAALWIIGALLILSNLGVNVTSLIASLGIGGIAVALALQNVLSDLFSAFSIYIDKPFEVGDFIVVGDKMGTVEKIGLKTTRVRSLSGEQIVMSNQELTGARIQNFKRMNKRRVVVRIGVTYDTPKKKLEQIPTMIKDIVDHQGELIFFDRCHFDTYGESSLDFELVYFVNSSEYNDYMDQKQKINLEIFDRFAKEKIEFAFPSRTIYLQK